MSRTSRTVAEIRIKERRHTPDVSGRSSDGVQMRERHVKFQDRNNLAHRPWRRRRENPESARTLTHRPLSRVKDNLASLGDAQSTEQS
jgi:hypothetical protein